MTKSIFFDLDGTLWNALVPLTESYNEAMAKEGLPYRFTLDMMKSYMGLTPEETVPLAFPDVDFQTGLKYFRICVKAEIAYLRDHPGFLYPQEERVLAELSQKYPLYVVSNADKGYIENYLCSCHMEPYFRGHLCAGDTGKAKWENIQYLREQLGFDQVIYLGDTLKDKVESEKAGAFFIHAAYGFGKIDDEPNEIYNLAELPALVEKIFNNKY